VHQTEKSLQENEEKVAGIKPEVEKAIADAKEVMDSEDIEKLKGAVQALSQAAMKIGEAVYAGQQGGASEASGDDGAQSGSGDENVVDADYEEVKDDKKSA